MESALENVHRRRSDRLFSGTRHGRGEPVMAVHRASPVAGLRPPRPARVYSVLMAMIGLTLLGGGLWLVALGGSPYYVLCGAALIVSSVLLWQGRLLGSFVYAGMLLVTLAWAI